MKKRLTKIIATFMTVTILCGTLLPFAAFATIASPNGGEIAPRLSNCDTCTYTFTVTDPNLAMVAISYIANEDYFTFVRATVKIQKKVLGLFWRTVDIGYPDNEWVVDGYLVDDVLYNEFTVDGNGTYRAVFHLEFYGNSGTTDVIDDSIEVEY